jgi:hypothetical protein
LNNETGNSAKSTKSKVSAVTNKSEPKKDLTPEVVNTLAAPSLSTSLLPISHVTTPTTCVPTLVTSASN